MELNPGFQAEVEWVVGGGRAGSGVGDFHGDGGEDGGGGIHGDGVVGGVLKDGLACVQQLLQFLEQKLLKSSPGQYFGMTVVDGGAAVADELAVDALRTRCHTHHHWGRPSVVVGCVFGGGVVVAGVGIMIVGDTIINIVSINIIIIGGGTNVVIIISIIIVIVIIVMILLPGHDEGGNDLLLRELRTGHHGVEHFVAEFHEEIGVVAGVVGG